MDPESTKAIETVVRECLAQGGDLPGWVRLVLAFLTIQITAISGKLGFDFYKTKKASSDNASRPMVETPTGPILDRRKWDPDRCGEHMKRITSMETALTDIKPDMARMEERVSSLIKRLEDGDQRFSELNKSINKLNTNTALLNDRIERLLKQ
jgi:peptidoglycan hydrolase CwlO-like protein